MTAPLPRHCARWWKPWTWRRRRGVDYAETFAGEFRHVYNEAGSYVIEFRDHHPQGRSAIPQHWRRRQRIGAVLITVSLVFFLFAVLFVAITATWTPLIVILLTISAVFLLVSIGIYRATWRRLRRDYDNTTDQMF